MQQADRLSDSNTTKGLLIVQELVRRTSYSFAFQTRIRFL